MAFSNGPTIVTSGLILYLDAADTNSYVGSGTTWSDLSGYGNTGTFQGAVTGSYNNVSFPYSNSTTLAYVNVPNSTDLQATGNTDFTVSFWFATSASYVSNNRTIIEKPQNSITPGWSIWLDASVLKTRLAYSVGFVDASAVVSSTFVTGSFSNMAMVISRTAGFCYWYRNGALVSSTSISALGDMTNTVSIRIGAGTAGFGVGTFGGNIPCVSMYNKALTATEVLQNFNATKTRFRV